MCYARKATYNTFQSAFTINKDPPPRLDLAKTRYGGPFTSAQVEDVKTFYRLLLILISTIGSLMLITAVSLTIKHIVIEMWLPCCIINDEVTKVSEFSEKCVTLLICPTFFHLFIYGIIPYVT